jgi:hypothetical protein
MDHEEKLFEELFECYKKLMADRSARKSQMAATCWPMWIYKYKD